MLKGARKDRRTIDSSWQKAQDPLDGVIVREVRHVPGDQGVLTELFRQGWDSTGVVAQVFQVVLRPGGLSAWHCHMQTTDRLFVARGEAKLVLFDAREQSPTQGRLNEFHAGFSRPMLVVVPPGVWHGLQNVGTEDIVVVNMPTEPYVYDDPDHYRLPADTTEIPYRWRTGAATPGGQAGEG